MKPTSFPFEIRSNSPYGAAMKPSGANYRDFPVRLSIPSLQGAFSPRQRMELRDESGAVVPASVSPFLHWPDGSVRAWEVKLPVTLGLCEKRRFNLRRAGVSSSKFRVP